jgi:putative flavoprotein involved in K+ transport
LDVLVIGAGQAGLVMGHALAQRGVDFRIIDAGDAVGGTWRRRWDSLRLFTAAQYNDLPGMRFPAPPDTYPTKDDVADFLAAYASEFELPISLGTEVTSLRRNGSYVAETASGEIRAKRVVVATGPFQVPFVPPIAERLDPRVPQLHSVDYRDPESLPEGRVLVVGGANTGCQIALELSESREVDIAVGRRLPTVPQRPFGRDVWWLGTKLGITRVTVDSRLGQRMSQRDVIIGGGLRELKRHGVALRPRAVTADGSSIGFDDGSSADYDAVIWATGFKVDHSWIDVPDTKDEQGQIEHTRGVTNAPGLYLLGMTWQYKRTSALLGWVAEDAAYLAEQIAPTNGSSLRPTNRAAETGVHV